MRTFGPCKIAICISYRQVLFSLHWITLIGWGTGWPRKVSRFGADGWLPRHRWLASWESEEEKKPHSLICFQYKWKIQTDGFALGFLFLFCFFFLSLSFARYILFPLKCSKVNIYALRVWIPLCLSQKDIRTRLNSTNVRTVN